MYSYVIMGIQIHKFNHLVYDVWHQSISFKVYKTRRSMSKLNEEGMSQGSWCGNMYTIIYVMS